MENQKPRRLASFPMPHCLSQTSAQASAARSVPLHQNSKVQFSLLPDGTQELDKLCGLQSKFTGALTSNQYLHVVAYAPRSWSWLVIPNNKPTELLQYPPAISGSKKIEATKLVLWFFVTESLLPPGREAGILIYFLDFIQQLWDHESGHIFNFIDKNVKMGAFSRPHFGAACMHSALGSRAAVLDLAPVDASAVHVSLQHSNYYVQCFAVWTHTHSPCS